MPISKLSIYMIHTQTLVKDKTKTNPKAATFETKIVHVYTPPFGRTLIRDRHRNQIVNVIVIPRLSKSTTQAC